MRTTAIVFIAALLPGTLGCCHAAEVLSSDFSQTPQSPWFKLIGGARVEDGVLKTAARADSARCGMAVGPLPMEGANWLIEYDFMPLALGEQCQAFASVTPSPKHYLAFVQHYGHMLLWTKASDTFARRSRSDHWLQAGTWYHVTIRMSATKLSFWLKARDGGGLWDSGVTAMDDLGKETTFALVDMSSQPGGKTQWDNLRISTDDPALVAKIKQLTERMRAR